MKTGPDTRDWNLRPPRPSAAFTLLELLIATSIFATVFLAINAVFYGSMRLHSATTRHVEESLPVNRAAVFLKRDLQNMLAPGGSNSFLGEFVSGVVSNVVADPLSSLEFHTTTGAASEELPWGDVQRVAYTLMSPTNRTAQAGRDLVRLVTRNLIPPGTVELPEERRLLSGVERLEFYFYDGTGWVDYWDSTVNELALPRAVKVRLEMAEAADTRRAPPAIQFVVPVSVQKMTNSATAGTGGGV